ncbi:PDCD2_C domain protein [Aspergillus sclerotialis]|uniref:PDCD2_C domain protein n=1 Tax=Aspergillus sclerotialis TaxID=2070753 RepID=A0A3A2ZVX3_9EURO|nr:PDCD2_C domain protein [Aspergillus sclerotialis]
MDPYDSDSSGLEDEDFTDTGVLLGYASEEVIDDTISHLGGLPTWLDASTPPPGDFANCKVCNRPMHLLLELHGDLPEHFPDDERRLYIFGCCRKTCNRKQGSIRALRATRKIKVEQPEKSKTEETEKKEEEKKPEAPKQDLGASLFGAGSLTGSVSGNANPFSSSSGSSSAQPNPFATPATPASSPSQQKSTSKQPEPQTVSTLTESFADKVRISSTPKIPPPEAAGPPTPWPPQSAFPKPYPHLYLDAEYETLSRPSTPTIPENVTFEPVEVDNAAGSSSAAASADLKDAFESELDKAFQRFSSRLSQNPEQVLRYEFGGSPLLYTYTDEVGKKLHDPKNPDAKVNILPSGGSRIASCEYCGSERVFELQLVPHAISVLEEGREGVGLGPKDDPGMEWGTIILGVCGRDCAPTQIGVVGWREEWVGVQWEEIK